MSVERLITDNIDVWTSTVKTKSASGRGSSKKIELYGIKKLRELILELAVRGKLVPQDPNDEPASVLLERIAEEKALLVKDKKIKKSKALPVVSKEEQSFVLPKGWAWERIGTFGVVGTGSTPSRSKPEYWEPAEFNWVSSGETSEFFVSATKERISGLAIEETNVSIYPKGTLIVAMYGQGKTRGQITELLESAGTNQACAAIQLVELSQDHKNYVKLFFRKAYLDLRSQAAGGAQPNLNVGKISNTVIPVPPLLEQNRIVTKVDELMALCDQLEQQTETSIEAHQTLVEVLLNTLTSSADAQELMQNWLRISEHFDALFTTEKSIDTLKQTILQLAVMGKLVPQDPNDEPAVKLLERIAEDKEQLIKDKKIKKQKALPEITDDEKPFDLPSGWEVCRLAGLIPQFQNGASSRGDKDGREVVVLRLADIRDWQVSLNDTRSILIENKSIERYSLEQGDVLIIRVNGSADIVGRFITCNEDYDAIYCDHFIRMRFPIECYVSSFLSILGSSKLVRDKISDLFISTAGQKTVNQTHIGSLITMLPPIAEQHRIVAKVKELMAVCDQLKTRLKDSQTTQLHLTDAIIDKAL